MAQGGTTATTAQPDLRRPADPVPTSALGGLGLAVVLCAQLVVVLDFSIVNVALPDISSELGVSSTTVQWIVTAYAITFGGLLVLGGRAADLFGRHEPWPLPERLASTGARHRRGAAIRGRVMCRDRATCILCSMPPYAKRL